MKQFIARLCRLSSSPSVKRRGHSIGATQEAKHDKGDPSCTLSTESPVPSAETLLASVTSACYEATSNLRATVVSWMYHESFVFQKWPGFPSSFLFLVVRPGAPGSVLAPCFFFCMSFPFTCFPALPCPFSINASLLCLYFSSWYCFASSMVTFFLHMFVNCILLPLSRAYIFS